MRLYESRWFWLAVFIVGCAIGLATAEWAVVPR